MGLKRLDQLRNPFDPSNLAMLRDAIKNDHNGDDLAFLKAYVDECNHNSKSQELVYIYKTLYYFTIDLHHEVLEYWINKNK